MLIPGFNLLENLLHNVCLVGISVLGCCVCRAGLLVIYFSSCEMVLEVVPCIFSSGFVVPFFDWICEDQCIFDDDTSRANPLLISFGRDMRVCHYGILGDNTEDVFFGIVINVGVIDDFLTFLVESLIRKFCWRYQIDRPLEKWRCLWQFRCIHWFLEL